MLRLKTNSKHKFNYDKNLDVKKLVNYSKKKQEVTDDLSVCMLPPKKLHKTLFTLSVFLFTTLVWLENRLETHKMSFKYPRK